MSQRPLYLNQEKMFPHLSQTMILFTKHVFFVLSKYITISGRHGGAVDSTDAYGIFVWSFHVLSTSACRECERLFAGMCQLCPGSIQGVPWSAPASCMS